MFVVFFVHFFIKLTLKWEGNIYFLQLCNSVEFSFKKILIFFILVHYRVRKDMKLIFCSFFFFLKCIKYQNTGISEYSLYISFENIYPLYWCIPYSGAKRPRSNRLKGKMTCYLTAHKHWMTAKSDYTKHPKIFFKGKYMFLSISCTFIL